MVRFLTFILVITLSLNLQSQIVLKEIITPSEIDEGTFESYEIDTDNSTQSGNLICHWDFGDGSPKALLNSFKTGHIYSDDGSYAIDFSTQDEEGQILSLSKTIKVNNVRPEIRYLNGKNTDFANQKATFEAVVYDPGDDQITYKWDFGDGNIKEGTSYDEVSHFYTLPGVYTVRLEVDDGDGGKDSESITISVENDWYGSTSGDLDLNLAGATSIMYQTRIDTITREVTSCFKAITLYDDNTNTFFWLFNQSMLRLADNSFEIGKGEDKFYLSLRNYLMTSLYENQKTGFRIQEVQEDWTQFTGSAFRQLSLIPDMLNAAQTGEDIYGHSFEAVSGTVNFEPMVGGRLKGSLSALMCERCESEDPENPPQYINVDLSFNIRVNDVAAWHMSVGCEEELNPFSILDFSLGNDKVNVNPDDPCLEVTFTENIDPNSITANNIKLGYYDGSEQFKIADIAIDYTDPSKILIIPKDALRNGVKYQLMIQDGPQGLKSDQGGQLTQAEEWTFSTLIEPNELSVKVYQSVADAPLITDKNTVVRILLNWEKPSDVSDRSFVKEFPAVIKMRGNGRRLGRDEAVTIKHQSEFNREDTTMARNTQNLYSWKPRPSDGNTMDIEIIPNYQVCPTGGEDLKYQVTYNMKHAGMKPKLKMEYYYLKSGLTDFINELELADIYEYIRKNNRLSEQIFPIYEIQSIYKGSLIAEEIMDIQTADIDSIVDLTEGGAGGVMAYQLLSLMEDGLFEFALERIYNELILTSDADIVVMIYSFKIGAPGETFRSNGDGFRPMWGKEFITIRFDEVEKHLKRPTLAHELGHTFYLEHVPRAAIDEIREIVASLPFDHWEDEIWHDHIDGFRIIPNGNRGYVKSCDHGNGESDELASIMFPDLANVFYKEAWIDKPQYLKALKHIKQSGKGLSFHAPDSELGYEWASIAGSKPVLEETISVYVSGQYDRRSGDVEITAVRPLEHKVGYAPIEGFLTLSCLDEAGKVIARQSFSPVPDIQTCSIEKSQDVIPFYTSIEIPRNASPSTFSIVEKDKTLDSYSVSSYGPTFQIISPSANDTLEGLTSFEFAGSDPDHEELNFKVYYSPNGVQEWQLIKILNGAKTDINVSGLKPGENPVFKVEVSDGYHTSSKLIPVHLDFPFIMEWYTPNRRLGSMEDIIIKFSNPIKPSSKSDQWFKIFERDQSGKISAVPYRVEYSEDFLSIKIIPHEALTPNSEYKISYRKGPSKEEIAKKEREEKEKKEREAQAKQKSSPLKRFLAKQVDKLTSDDENKENANVLKDMLGLPTDEKPKPQEEEEDEEVRRSPLDIADLILGKEEESEELIEDIFGNKLMEHFSWQFKYID
ncbi:PKD domain-containing protein [Portibacter marinus]|uniref:PKD domain-containing protein n=1 Tax=Portibacter marinus TaxID=2898660 RepID=UPI001F2BF53C|nr:PKD domain-containing protein [Portibacter marinus]